MMFCVQGSEDPDAHAQYVWDNFIVKSKAQRIAIVAFSAGGVVATNLVRAVMNLESKIESP